MKGGQPSMTTADLIWYLIEILLKDKEKSDVNEKQEN